MAAVQHRLLVVVVLAAGIASCGSPEEFGQVVQAEPAFFEGFFRGIGAPCHCEGQDCETLGVPQPDHGSIFGCADVPPVWNGGQKVCLRSYVGARANDTHFANGYCAIMATHCEGAALICSNARFGDYARLTRCPPGTVLIQGREQVRVDLGILGTHQATLDTRVCAAACTGDADCRVGEVDPALDEPSEYQCVVEDEVGCCYDPRSLSPQHQFTAF
ncbi:MAG: hypothetical protein ABIJ09_07340 [Pseudomonadota bacterium]